MISLAKMAKATKFEVTVMSRSVRKGSGVWKVGAGVEVVAHSVPLAPTQEILFEDL